MEVQIYEDIAMQRVLHMFLNSSFSTGRIQREDNYREIMFDFEIISDTGESLTYEVKRNKKVDEYGYYFFEIRDDKGMYSGLAKTKAEFHILVKNYKIESLSIDNSAASVFCITTPTQFESRKYRNFCFFFHYRLSLPIRLSTCKPPISCCV